ncbi:MAG TPA: O-antigen ligase family protein [Gaiellaceae bacterium]|nr:O-antigen ligase family protein [Gaiellaceae bacterium]
MRAAVERVGAFAPAAAAAPLAAAPVACALFFGAGDSDAPLVWIGALALALGAVLLVRAPALGRPAAVLLVSLGGLALWCGLTTVWSISPDASWRTTNRTLVYVAFALLGVLAGSHTVRSTVVRAGALLLGAVAAWALVVKCVPPLYADYDRVARLRAPVVYWNELALLCALGVPLALWSATRRRVEGVVLVYLFTVTVLLTYSRYGVLLAAVAAAAFVVVDRNRVESIAALAVGATTGIAAFGVALALPGITSDGVTRATRVHDSWIFALVLAAGLAVVATCAAALRGREVSPAARRRIERAAAVSGVVLAVAVVVVSIVLGGRLWREFTSPGTQLQNGSARLASAKSNRWEWWQEAWHSFTRHPLGGTGAGTFEFTNKLLRKAPIEVDDPHSTPLRFLSETGIVGFLLLAGAAGGALWGAWRARADPGGVALGIAVAAFFAHTLVDKDWNYVAGCAPSLFLAGAVVAVPQTAFARRPLLALAAAAVALAVVYSLAAPWLSDRQVAAASTPSGWKRAHTYDPLAVDPLLDWAAYEEATGQLERAASLYADATKLEPENARTWYELGRFYYDQRLWKLAYDALNTSYTYDRFGRAGIRCGLLDRARWNAGYRFGVRCPGAGRASSP